jgi:transposase
VEHIGIDLGGRESQICVRSEDGTVQQEARWATKSLHAYLATRPKSRVVLETCAEAFAVADAALSVGHEVRVVPGSLVRSLGVGARRTKNDRKDAQVLSEVSCRMDLPSVHVPSALARRRKSFCGMRDALVGARTQLINTVRGWLRTQGCGAPRKGSVETFPLRVRDHYGAEDLPNYVERQLVAIEFLNQQVGESDEELVRMADKDDECRRLMTVPGVGPVTAVRFAAAVDGVERFKSAHELESYFGLVPGEDSSGDRRRRTSLTKAGSADVRRSLIQGAWAARRCRTVHPMVLWADEVQKRRGAFVATVALARKMAGIMFALLRDDTTYHPLRGALVR